MKKRVLVIGSSGMLGVDLCAELRTSCDVRGADIVPDPAGRGSSAGKRALRFLGCDITDRNSVARVIRTARPDIAILTAAWTDVDGCERDPQRAYRVNAVGPRHVARACRAAGIPLIFISTDFVFSGKKRTPYRETDETGPLSIYGDSKLQGERAVLRELPDAVIVRTSWLYGRHGKNFVDTIIAKGKTEPVLKVVDDQAGSPTYTRDLAAALHALVRPLLAGTARGIYHVSNRGRVSWYGYARAILREAGVKARVVPIASRELARPARRPSMSEMDTSKFRSATGYVMRHWKSALRDYIRS